MFIEQRQTERKILKTKAMLTMDGAVAEQARTIDISASGMCVTLSGPHKIGAQGTIIFDLFFEGKATPIRAKAKVSYCIFSNGEFKIGLQFLNLDLSAMTVLAKYLR